MAETEIKSINGRTLCDTTARENYEKLDIPTKTSQLNNDSGFITLDDIPKQDPVDFSAYALKTELPTKISQLSNDSGFITVKDIPEQKEVDLSNYYTKEEVNQVASIFVTTYQLESKGYQNETQVRTLIDEVIVDALNSEV